MTEQPGRLLNKPGNVRDLGYENVLVPLDGSDKASVAVATARALGDRLSARVHAVAAVRTMDEGDSMRLRAAAALEIDPADERVETVVSRSPALAISRRSAELAPCLVCMSTSARGRFAGGVVRSIAEDVLRATDRPVMVVGPMADRRLYFERSRPTPLSIPRIVACVDVGHRSDPRAAHAAIAASAQWATALDMSLTVLTVLQPTASSNNDDSELAVLERLRRVVSEVCLDGPEVDVVVHTDPIGTKDGFAAHLAKRPAGLVVVSHPLRSGRLRRLMRGTTSTDIVRAVPAPTLIVPVGPAA